MTARHTRRSCASTVLLSVLGVAALVSGGTPRAAGPQFVESAVERGLAFTHVNGATGQYYLPEEMGAGAALFDYDGDGDLDVLLLQGGSLPAAPPGSRSPATGTRLFRNDLTVDKSGRPALHFTDVTAQARLDVNVYAMGVATGDYDGDGRLDLFVANYVDFSIAGNRRCVDPVGAPDYCSPRVYRPVPDRL